MVILSTWIKGAQQIFKFETTTQAIKFVNELREYIPDFYVVITEDTPNLGVQPNIPFKDSKEGVRSFKKDKKPFRFFASR